MIDLIVYFSTSTNNTHRFVQSLNIDSIRIPKKFSEDMPVIDRPFCLITPTYRGGESITGGQKSAVPKQVHRFLEIENNLRNAKLVVASGNINFGKDFCIAGDEIQKMYSIPYKYRFELMGTDEDRLILESELRRFPA